MRTACSHRRSTTTSTACDLVIGDLPGRLTTARRLPGDGAPKFGPETKVLAANGEQVDLQNW